jgi:purine-binding chemotaxis protein CheW
MTAMELNGQTLAPAGQLSDGLFAVLGFSSRGESYAFPLSSVHEILSPPPITEVPMAPAEVLGVITVRGQIVTVVDFRRVLERQSLLTRDAAAILLVDNSGELIGVAVDGVSQVYRLRREQIEYASAMNADLSDYVLGIGRVKEAGEGETMLVLVDPVALLGG